MVIPEADISLLKGRVRKAGKGALRSTGPTVPSFSRQPAPSAWVDVDLHGLTVEEALRRSEDALNEALLADLAELRLIHGRTSSWGGLRRAMPFAGVTA